MIGKGAGAMPGTEAYDAEILSTQKAPEAAISKAGDSPIKVLLDNPAAVRALQRGRAKSSQRIVDKFASQVQRHYSVEIRWIPGHSGIIGNEEADKLAKAALSGLSATTTMNPLEMRGEYRYTFAALAHFIRERGDAAVESRWLDHRSSRYDDLELQMKKKRPPELGLSRCAYHRLIAARTGFGDSKSYHDRFGHENIDSKCVCRREKRPWHFAKCRWALQNWRKSNFGTSADRANDVSEKGCEDFYHILTVSKCHGEQSLIRRG